MVAYDAAQRAGTSHHCIINMSNNAIFMHMYLHAAFTKWEMFGMEMSSTFNIVHTKFDHDCSDKAFQDMSLQESGYLLCFSFLPFLHAYKSCHKMQTCYSISFPLGKHTADLTANLGTKFDWVVINNYSGKITSICCHR